MSLFGALSTAISGINAQSSAFGNISDNIANSQTVGFKRIDTSFTDYLTQSSQDINDSGSVTATPDYANSVQGTITQTQNALNLAISGQGFFAVSEQNGQTNGGQPTFSTQQYYTRTGDFSMDQNGYLTNSSGDFLNGWAVDSTGAVQKNALAPIQVAQTVYSPVATSNVTMAANLPATPSSTTPVSSQVQVYDSLGNEHTVTLDWTQSSLNNWTVSVNVPDDTSSAARGTANVEFGATASGNAVPDGTVGNIDGATGSVTSAGYSANGTAELSFTTNFGSGPQTINLNLGTYGQSNGVTQYAGSDYTLHSLSQDGIPPGAFSSAAIQTNGDVVVNYDNGQSRTIAQVPVMTFNNADGLQRQNGQAFTATSDSGSALADDPSVNGAGSLVASSVESSNVDIASEFTNLIVAQQAYSANTKVVTTADDMLQQTIDMIR